VAGRADRISAPRSFLVIIQLASSLQLDVKVSCIRIAGTEFAHMPQAKREEGKKVNSNINVTPMVDVMLVLLIIFMVITPMLNNKVNVNLPTADMAVVMEDANKEDAIIVAVTRDGKVFLGADPIASVDDLGPKISSKFDGKPEGPKTVYLRADVRAKYGPVMDAIDGIRAAGVSQLGLITEKPGT
jgi:biopolymer transport protein ExbD/biopolymer transport protein TolR